MKTIKRFLVLSFMIMAVLSLVACGGSEETAGHDEPYFLEDIAGSDFKLVVLTDKAAERLDIQSEEVVELSVPYSSVIYDLNGETYVYTRNPEAGSLSFVRAPITVERIDGGLAILSAGPDFGTQVVTRGVSELFGAETGVGK